MQRKEEQKNNQRIRMVREMKKFRFEIQNCIDVNIEAENAEDARMQIVENISDYAEQMVDGSCYVSDGVEVTND